MKINMIMLSLILSFCMINNLHTLSNNGAVSLEPKQDGFVFDRLSGGGSSSSSSRSGGSSSSGGSSRSSGGGGGGGSSRSAGGGGGSRSAGGGGSRSGGGSSGSRGSGSSSRGSSYTPGYTYPTGGYADDYPNDGRFHMATVSFKIMPVFTMIFLCVRAIR